LARDPGFATIEPVRTEAAANPLETVPTSADLRVVSAGPAPEPELLVVPRARVRWTAFRYRVRSESSRHRVAVSRSLKRLGAFHLDHALWAVPHRVGEPDPTGPTVASIRGAGGEAEAYEVVADHPDAADLDARLAAATDRLWDGFFNQVDRLTYAIEQGAAPASVADPLDELRFVHRHLTARDMLRRDAHARASHRLDVCIDLCRDLVPPDDPLFRPRAGRVALGPSQNWVTADDLAEYVVPVDDLPSVGWEQAFGEFERTIYQPAADRPVLHHGVFSLTCVPAEWPPIGARLLQRIQIFGASLDE